MAPALSETELIQQTACLRPLSQDSIPIVGGFKQSGTGKELGYHGLDDFLEVKQIFTDGTGLAVKPAYGQLIKEG